MKREERLVQTRSSGWLAWLLWVLTLLGLAATAWLDHLLRLAGRPELTWSQSGGGGSYGLAAVSAATVGAVVASRRSSHPVGGCCSAWACRSRFRASSRAM
jgi:hypothetical protein